MEDDMATKIQSMYNGHKIRNKTFYFKQMPRDIQVKIIWYMNESIYEKSLQKVILKILNKRINQFFSKYYIFHDGNDITVTNVFTKIIEEEVSFAAENLIKNDDNYFTCYDNLINIMDLFIKYSSIIKKKTDIDNFQYLFFVCDKIYTCGYFYNTFNKRYTIILNKMLYLICDTTNII